jgi:hypothetical protein
MGRRELAGTLAAVLLAGVAAALPASAQTTPPPPPGAPVSPPPTGVVTRTPPPTAPPPTAPRPVPRAPASPPPTTAAGLAPTPTTNPPVTRRPAVVRRTPTAPRPSPAALVPTPVVAPRPAPRSPARAAAPRASGARTPAAPVVPTGDGLVVVEPLPTPDVGEPAPAPPRDLEPRTAPTQRRLDAGSDRDAVAAPAGTGLPTAASRPGGAGGFLRSELVPLLLLGGAVATAYVACLQVAVRRRDRRALR